MSGVGVIVPVLNANTKIFWSRKEPLEGFSYIYFMAQDIQARQLVDHLFRHEFGRIIANLTRRFGTSMIEEIEDAVQDALLKAMQMWPFGTTPQNPVGWILRVAQNNLLDQLRKGQTRDRYVNTQLDSKKSDNHEEVVLEEELSDDLLKMIFACCHPSLPPENQMILTLKILAGFGKKEIARALLKSEDAIAKTYTRARGRFKEYVASIEVPIGRELSTRLDNVLKIIYVIFNEGYSSFDEDQLIRKDLCLEAIRLTNLLAEHKLLAKPEVHALMALMLFQVSRFDARLDHNGEIVTLEYQDRRLWEGKLIAKGEYYLNKSVAFGGVSEYHVQASIAAMHCFAPSYQETNWKQILHLYDILLKIKPTAIIRLNRIVAYEKVYGASKALKEFEKIAGETSLRSYYLFYAVKATILIEANRLSEAKSQLEKAISLTKNRKEINLFKKRIDELQVT